jgi:hypothetical protein
MQPQITFWHLTWKEISTQNTIFDPAALRPRLEEILTQLVSAHARTPAKGKRRPRWEEVRLLNDAIVDTYGPWASGWCFSCGEGGGGGVVDATKWCCPEHSLFPKGYSVDQVGEHADRILRALGDWRDHLCRLGELFKAVERPVDPAGAQLALRKAVARLVTWVIEATGCDDAWYAYLERTLSWLLEHLGLDPGQARAVVDQVVKGRFESWIQPQPGELEQMTDELAALAEAKLHPTERHA